LKNYFVCSENNELYNLIKAQKKTCIRYNNLQEALTQMEKNSHLYIFEESYPQKKQVITKEVLDTLKEKEIKTFIEYPKSVYELKQDITIKIDRQRIVNIKNKKIGQNNCSYVIFSSKISSPITSRFKPINFWKNLYKDIFNIDIVYEDSVKPTFSKQYEISKRDILNARIKSLNWFKTHMLLNDNIGTKVYEGYQSSVNENGSQNLASAIRTDCIGESSLVFALDYVIGNDKNSYNISNNLIKYIFQEINQNLDMNNDIGGFIKWYGQGDNIYYTDDNARLLLGVLPSIGILNKSKYNEGIIKCVLAYVRSIGDNGIHMDSLRSNHFYNVLDYTYKDIKTKKETKYSPHYVSYIWAVFLLIYDMTGDKQLLDISKKGIYNMMDKYPNKWKWTNGIMAEVSRMILPLAMLYKYDNSKKTKGYLDILINEIDNQTNQVGCMIEKMTLLENGKYPPPKCNEDYGKYEAPIIQKDGDMACDLLYSMNFAYLGVHEAYMATKDIKYKQISDKMTDFLIKIQTTSSKHSNLNGVWLRSFDSSMWEYWGSGADAGWAALCVESGWTNSWINIVLALREQNKSISDYITRNENFKNMYYDIKEQL